MRQGQVNDSDKPTEQAGCGESPGASTCHRTDGVAGRSTAVVRSSSRAGSAERAGSVTRSTACHRP